MSASAAEAFRCLQAGLAEQALKAARRAASEHPTAGRPRLAEGIALRMLGRLDEAREALDRAARLDPRDGAIAYERGVVAQLSGDLDRALAQFEQARVLKPDFFAAHFSSGSLRFDRGEWPEAIERLRTAAGLNPRQFEARHWLARALLKAGRPEEAEREYIHALAANPHDFELLSEFGRYSVSRGNFQRAASLFREALRLRPEDDALPMYLVQTELTLGNWAAAWGAYAHRVTRRHLERTLAAQGDNYRVPARASLAGRDVVLMAEQGFGDILFFLRWAPALREAGARLRLIGPKGLLPMLSRIGLFESLHEFGARDVPAAIPIMIGDLPSVAPAPDPTTVPGLRISPRPDRLEQWRSRLDAAGPRPWVGLTWRAGLPPEELQHGLYKTIEPRLLRPVVEATGGTAIALQRKPAPGEIAQVGEALGCDLHDFSDANDDLEDALALVALLDRHIGVSNTNMHLADAAGRTADVLVPYPPEWRWRIEGDSPWFPGFRVHRQTRDGDWGPALAILVKAPGGNTSRG